VTPDGLLEGVGYYEGFCFWQISHCYNMVLGTSVVMFGGGMKKGYIHGQTADERPLVAVKDPVTVMDLHATIMTAMGISPKTEFTIEGRPFYVTEDGKGQAVRDIIG
jgi:hypothetical protein